MGKRLTALSFLQLVISAFALLTVSLAWFTLSKDANTSDIDIGVSEGFVNSYRYIIYTPEDVYKYEQSSNTFSVFDVNTSSWVAPSATVQSLNGILINAYDSLIPENNINNHVFVELYIEYGFDQDTTVIPRLKSIPSLANDAIQEVQPWTSRPYYLSEVIYSQMLVTDNFASHPLGNNLYHDLMTAFLNQPEYSFYDTFDVYQSMLTFDSVVFPNDASNDIYLYFSLNYLEDKIEDILSIENASFNFDADNNSIYFFQDLRISLSGGPS